MPGTPKRSHITKDAITRLVETIISVKNGFRKENLDWMRSDLKWGLEKLGFDKTTTLKKLVQNPAIFKLNHNILGAIYRIYGIGNTPNKQWLQKLGNAVFEFPKFGNYSERSDRISAIAEIKNNLKRGFVIENYNLFPNRRELHGLIPANQINETLTETEMLAVYRLLEPIYQDLFSMYLSDSSIQSAVREEIKRRYSANSNEIKLTQIDLCQTMPELFEWIKERILNNTGVRWETLKVNTRFVSSSNSTVVSSSFSTYYHYDVTIEIENETFEYQNVIMGSSYYSGGWN